MIVIFSIYNDFTTSDVIEWLQYYGEEVIRINQEDDFYSLDKIDIDANEIIIRDRKENKTINLLDATAIWYRKGGMFHNFFNLKVKQETLKSIFPDEGHERYILNALMNETHVLLGYILPKLEKHCKSLGKYVNRNLNKLHVLELARESGLHIPETYVLHNREQIVSLLEDQKKLITKSLSDGIYLFGKKNAYYTFTEEVFAGTISHPKLNIFHSLFQEKLKKQYEIRSFYLDGEFYSMAIFSQSNAKTEVDFRKYDNVKPNRYVPYKLPDETEDKLRVLMHKIELNTGSIDLVLDRENNYYFLEVNPVGQFGMVSAPCNYYLEQKVANFLRQ